MASQRRRAARPLVHRGAVGALLCVALIGGCGGNLPDSVGPGQEIVVLADPDDWKALEAPLRDVFERAIRTPQEERTFRIQRGSAEDLERYRRRKILLLVAPLDASHAEARLVRSLVSPPAIEAMASGAPPVSWKEDVWAREQLLMVLVGRDRQDLLGNLKTEADRLYRAVGQARDKGVERLVFSYGERKDLADRLAGAYGWSVRVPSGYELSEGRSDSGFVALTREEPSRWLFVYWEDGVPPDRLTPGWCIDKRDEIARRFFDGDRIAPGDVETGKVEFAGRLAVSLQGLWENQKRWTGGPFKSYALVDADRNRFFFVDVGVFSPDKKKEPYLRQVDLIARTFSLGTRLKTP